MNKVGVEYLILSGVFATVMSIACLCIMGYVVQFSRKRDEYYKRQFDAISKIIEGNNSVQKLLIEQIQALIKSMK